ncbi:MAG: UrcA family protein [Gammaproteobacteria bacterium]|nr:UrcA family protein [Gammaproteobacteria bacterium]
MNTATLITSTSPTRQSFRRLACVALFCILGTAQSWAGSSERSITVSFRDLDLSTLAGATTLYQRIQTAAKQVCSRSGGDPIEQMGWKACYRRATTEAVGKVNNPLLTAVHSGRTPEITAMLSK